MCLKKTNSLDKTKKFKDAIGRNGIKVYKVVHIGCNVYYPLHQKTSIFFKEGKDIANTDKKIYAYGSDSDYQAGFHFWINKTSAKKHLRRLNYNRKHDTLSWIMSQGPFKVIECVVKKSWITATGEDGLSCELKAVVVTSKAIFPKFEEIG